jgi:glycosyltransferase involved in cell wall biosynthesis
MTKLRLLRNEKSNFIKIGLYAVIQRTMPETSRAIFRFLMWIHLGILSSFQKSIPVSEQNRILEEGCANLRQGRIEEAKEHFRSLLKKSQVHEEAALWLTRTLLIQGNYLEAQKVLFRAMAWHRNSIPLRRSLAGLLHTTGSLWEAEREYKKLVNQSHTESVQTFLGLAALAFGDARYDEAFDWYAKAYKEDPQNLAATLGVIECSKLKDPTNRIVDEFTNHVVSAALRNNSVIQNVSVARSSGKHKDASVLVIDHFLPSTGSSAGSIHLYEIIKLFREAGCHVTVIGRNGEYQRRSKLELDALGAETYATDPDRLMAWNYKTKSDAIDFRQLFSKRQYVLAFLTRYHIADVYMDLLRKNVPGLPIAIDSEDVHFVREKRKELLYGSSNLDASALRAKELEVYNQADCLIAVSDPDAKVLKENFPGKKICTLPLIYETNQSTVPFRERKDLLFVGNFVHPPNSDAVVHYSGRILPYLKTKLPDVKTYVVGANSIPLLESFADANLILTGFVPTVQPFLDSCRVSVVPLRYGAGMNGKVLESMTAGVPVVTTPLVAEAIADDKGMMVAEDPEDFANAVAHLYHDEQLWNSIREQAYNTIQKRFTPAVVAKEIDELLAWAVQRRS